MSCAQSATPRAVYGHLMGDRLGDAKFLDRAMSVPSPQEAF
jgi:hypothetical protein